MTAGIAGLNQPGSLDLAHRVFTRLLSLRFSNNYG